MSRSVASALARAVALCLKWNASSPSRCGDLLSRAAIAALLIVPHPLHAEPTGGVIVPGSGSATITQTGPVTDINQSTPKAIINWQGFSIAPQETVNFHQPDVSSVTLNRVIGNERSVIEGALNANGQVFIVNSAGVLFTHGASVNVGGLVASTLDISNEDFNAGNYTFSGSSTASVVNQGSLSATQGGYISLLGNTVSNQGVISATLGTAALGAGSKVKLNFGGNSLVDLTIDKGVLNALVENKQLIKADGGKVILTARAADAILAAQVNNSGIVQARSVAALTGGYSKGSIELNAHGGTANVSGTLDASAPDGGDGGFIETSGDQVQILEGAVVTTKAEYASSGTWLIDPIDFTISFGSGGQTASGIGVNTLAASLANGFVGIATDGNININAALGAGTATNVTTNALSNSLTLTAGGDIYVNAPIYWNQNTLTLDAGRNIFVAAAGTGSTPALVGIGTAEFVASYGSGTNADGTPMGLYNVQGGYTSSTMAAINFSGSRGVKLNGTPYTVISNAAGLTSIAGNPSGNYVLGANISGVSLTENLGTFTGNLNGFGHSISGTLTGTGLFDAIGADGVVSNVWMATSISQSTTAPIATSSLGTLANVNRGTIVNAAASGGVNFTIVPTFAAGIDTLYTGGLVGTNYGLIAKGWAYNTVNATNVAGGLVGLNAAGGIIRDSSASGVLTSNAAVTTVGYAGGLVGINAGTIMTSYAKGPLVIATSANATTGGLVGWNKASGVIDQSYASPGNTASNVTYKNAGFAWTNDGKITNSYTTQLNGQFNGTYNANRWTSGFVNSNSGTIDGVYTVAHSGSGSAVAGGTLCGFACTNTGSITHAYWSATTEANAVTPVDTTTAKSLTPQEVATFSSYKGFDPAVWSASVSGYPVLGNIIVYVSAPAATSTPVYGQVTSDAATLGGQSMRGLQGGGGGAGPGDSLSGFYDPATNTVRNNFAVATDNGYVNAGTYSAASILSSSVYKNIVGTLGIAQLKLQFSGDLLADKTYDSTTTGTIAAGLPNYGLIGLVGDQTLKVTWGTVNFADANVGTGKTATVIYTLLDGTNGGRASNYSIVNVATTSAGVTSAPATGDILPKALTASFIASDKIYDGSAAASYSGVGPLNGIVGSEVVSLVTANASASFADANAGTGKTVTLSGLTLTGANASNYVIANQTTTATINPLVLQLNGLKPADGGVSVDGANIIAANLVWGDKIQFTGTVTLTSGAAGTQAIDSSSLGGLHINNGNYTLAGASGTIDVGGGNMVVGKIYDNSAAVDIVGKTTTVTQAADKAMIDWVRFNVAADETVNFDQQSSNWVILNRVIGNEQSVIEGAINAQGKVFVVNSAGVLFTGGSMVNVGALVASTLGMTKGVFDSGNYVFTPGSGHGSVIANGDIDAAAGGFITLASENGTTSTGHLTAPGGKVVLASAKKLTLNSEAADVGLAGYTIGDLSGTTAVDGVVNVAGAGVAAGGLVETAGASVSLASSSWLNTGNVGSWSLSLPAITIGSGGNIATSFVLNNLALRNFAVNALGGNLTVDDALSWSANTTLGLGARNDININNAITVNGASGGLTLAYGGDYHIRTKASYAGVAFDADGKPIPMVDPHDPTKGGDGIYGSVSFTNGANLHGLMINGQNYTLIRSMSDFVTATDAGKKYALALDLDACGVVNAVCSTATVYGAAVRTSLDGTLAGLGHTVDHLAINSQGGSDPVGLIGTSKAGSTVRDLGLTNVNVKSSSGNSAVLIGRGARTMVSGVYVTTGAAGNLDFAGTSGTLMGWSDGGSTFTNTFADITATNIAGGLIGQALTGDTVANSHVAGALGNATGGLISNASDTRIANSYFMGAYASQGVKIAQDSTGKILNADIVNNTLAGKVGGLVGTYSLDSGPNSITNSFAVANIGTDKGYPMVGGLIGKVDSFAFFTLDNSYWRGDIHAYGVNSSTANNAVGIAIGGLIGANAEGGTPTSTITISRSSVRGSIEVEGVATHSFDSVGGFVGLLSSPNNSSANVIRDSTAEVEISAAPISNVGGLVGTGYTTNYVNNRVSGNVIGGANVGGIVGRNVSFQYTDRVLGRIVIPNSLIDGTTFNGTLSGTGNVGALAGIGNQLKINNSYWSNNITAPPVGTGLVQSGQWTGGNKGLSQEAFANGDVQHYLDGTIEQVLSDRAAAATAAANLAAATRAANVTATSGIEKTQKSAATPADAKAGTAQTQAKAGPKLEDKVDLKAAPAAVTQLDDERRRRKKSAPADAGADYGAQIKSIDIDGQHFDLEKDDKAPAPSGTAPAPAGQQ